ncbi:MULTISPECIES: BMP family ABC transporter substrate-binding protein [Aminobacter]|uniref:BMP family ABC transporter substrate-binding protein n=1 Tax=Aminobacter TaxID=31988 RepID=UPI0012AEF0A9|nr:MULTISPECIES: BMP family ABC transporter substrate-binding protein [Aminobacter]MDR7224616.1 simple sugar transport system substrate-binding protein [Aminobacter aminovorans]
MKIWVRTLLGATALGLLLSGPAASDPFKIGYIIPNAIGEAGWDHELERGRQAIVDHFGDKVQVNAVNGVGEGPDATRVMNRMAADGTNMLILGAFGLMNDGLVLARRYPDLKVLHYGGYVNEPNFATLALRHYEASYLCGMAAGMAAKTGNLGVVAAFPLPEVLSIMNAYVLGAQSVNPDIKPVKVVWLNSWFDPAKEKAAAESLASQGAEVLYSLFPGTPSTVSTAEQLGVYVTVTLSDNTMFAPTKHLCSAQAEFGPALIRKIQDAIDGKFVGDDTFSGVKDGSMGIAGLSPDLSEEQKKQIMARLEEMRNGSFQPFRGPIMSNTGQEIAAEGTNLDDTAIKSMKFLVKGIDTTLPN